MSSYRPFYRPYTNGAYNLLLFTLNRLNVSSSKCHCRNIFRKDLIKGVVQPEFSVHVLYFFIYMYINISFTSIKQVIKQAGEISRNSCIMHLPVFHRITIAFIYWSISQEIKYGMHAYVFISIKLRFQRGITWPYYDKYLEVFGFGRNLSLWIFGPC